MIIPSKHLFIQIQHKKHYKKVQNKTEINNTAVLKVIRLQDKI